MKFLHLIIIVLLFPLTCSAAEGDFPAIYETTTRLNVRSSASTRASKITTLAPNTRIQVEYITSNGWAAIKYNNRERYVSAKYIRYLKSAVPETPAAVEPMAASSRKGFSILSAIPWVVGFAAVCFFRLSFSVFSLRSRIRFTGSRVSPSISSTGYSAMHQNRGESSIKIITDVTQETPSCAISTNGSKFRCI